jgi:hypothetical protein
MALGMIADQFVQVLHLVGVHWQVVGSPVNYIFGRDDNHFVASNALSLGGETERVYSISIS